MLKDLTRVSDFSSKVANSAKIGAIFYFNKKIPFKISVSILLAKLETSDWCLMFRSSSSEIAFAI